MRKIDSTRRYQVVPQGLRAISALVVLRDQVIKPLLAAACPLKTRPQPKASSTIDQYYEILRTDMLGLFQELRIAA